MRDTEATRSETCLLQENKKKTRLLLKITLNPRWLLKSTKSIRLNDGV